MNDFMNGALFSDVLNDAQKIGQSWRDRNTAQEETRQRSERDAKYQAIIDEQASDIAANLAEKHALRKALAKLDPKNPLLHNQMLHHKLHEVGARAFWINQNFDDARKAGEDLVP